MRRNEDGSVEVSAHELNAAGFHAVEYFHAGRWWILQGDSLGFGCQIRVNGTIYDPKTTNNGGDQ